MDKTLFDYTAQKVEELLEAASSSQTTREAAQGWKDAIAAGADTDTATTALLDAIDEHHTTIDDAIAFAQGPAKFVLGEEAAASMLTHELKRKEDGAKYCDCAACLATQELLAKHGRPVL